MSLATRCTSCGTVFRVVQDQLKVSEGWVRCGRCNEVFNALEGLFDLERDAPPEWQPRRRRRRRRQTQPARRPIERRCRRADDVGRAGARLTPRRRGRRPSSTSTAPSGIARPARRPIDAHLFEPRSAGRRRPPSRSTNATGSSSPTPASTPTCSPTTRVAPTSRDRRDAGEPASRRRCRSRQRRRSSTSCASAERTRALAQRARRALALGVASALLLRCCSRCRPATTSATPSPRAGRARGRCSPRWCELADCTHRARRAASTTCVVDSTALTPRRSARDAFRLSVTLRKPQRAAARACRRST